MPRSVNLARDDSCRRTLGYNLRPTRGICLMVSNSSGRAQLTERALVKMKVRALLLVVNLWRTISRL